MARVYTYQDLSGDESIRLLTIRPGHESEDLHVELEEVKVKDKLEFEAVSYCWGDQGLAATIYLGGDESQLQITPTLALALRQLRFQHQARTVWVDAICINQSNRDERSRQVLLMTQVYSMAKQVLIWLGESGPETHRAVECLERFAQKADDLDMEWDPNGFNYNPPIALKWSFEEVQDIVETGREACIFAVLRPAWFRRLWIVQEILLAQDATVICGAAMIPWKHFARALKLFDDAITELHSSLDDQDSQDLRRAITITQTRAQFRMWAAPNVMVVEPWSGSFILGIYETFRSQQCSDDRDRVFGFLALRGPEHALNFAPDYHWTVQQTYKEFALSLLQVEGGCRHLLNHAGIWHKEEAQSSNLDISSPTYLPSWAPDFRPTKTTSRLPATLRSLTSLNFGTASNFTGVLDYSGLDKNIIRFRGKIFDGLLALAVCGPDFEASSTLTKQLLGHYAWLDLEGYPAGGNAVDAFMRTMVMGDDTVEIERLRELWVGYRKVLFSDHDIKEHDEATLRAWLPVHNGIVATVKHDSCIVTNRGYFGLVPFATRLSDQIAVVAGLDTPVVVRWTEELGAYLLVGTCYIHGLMKQDDDHLSSDMVDDWISLA